MTVATLSGTLFSFFWRKAKGKKKKKTKANLHFWFQRTCLYDQVTVVDLCFKEEQTPSKEQKQLRICQCGGRRRRRRWQPSHNRKNPQSRCLTPTVSLLPALPPFFLFTLPLPVLLSLSVSSPLFPSSQLSTVRHTCTKQKRRIAFYPIQVGLVGLVETSSIPKRRIIFKKEKKKKSFFMYCFCRCSVLVRFKGDKWHLSEILYLQMQTRAGLKSPPLRPKCSAAAGASATLHLLLNRPSKFPLFDSDVKLQHQQRSCPEAGAKSQRLICPGAWFSLNILLLNVFGEVNVRGLNV